MIGWVNLFMLGGLAALSVPLLIHLLRSRRFEPAEIGTLRFLRRAARESVRRRRLRDLLLLLLRLLAVALLAVLFARPYRLLPGSEAGGDLEVVILLDASGSMTGRFLGKPLWNTAKEMAQTVLAHLPAGARVVTAAFADTVVEIAPDQGLPASAGVGCGTDHALALRWSADRLRQSTAATRRIVMITDLQRSGLPASPLPAWPQAVPVSILAVPSPGPFNAAIAAVENLTPYPAGDGRALVRITCWGDAPLAGIELSARVDGLAEQHLSLRPESQSAVVSWPGVAAGVQRASFRLLTPDAWPDDNGVDTLLVFRRSLAVGVVDATPPESWSESGGHFLSAALEGARDGEGRARYAVHSSPALGRLDGVGLLALCALPGLTEGTAQDVAEAVRQGMGLLLFLGDHVDETAWRALQRANLLPGGGGRTKVPVPEPVVEWDHSHPALQVFGPVETGALGRIVLRDAFRLEPRPGWAVLARLRGGNPAILATEIGRGRVIVVANPCGREWTDWPAERVFLPLVREAAAWAARRHEREGAATFVEASLAGPLAPGVGSADGLTVVSPHPPEGDVARASEEEFRAALGIGPAPVSELAGGEPELPPGRERPDEYWRWLGLALAGVLLLEIAVADWPRRRNS